MKQARLTFESCENVPNPMDSARRTPSSAWTRAPFFSSLIFIGLFLALTFTQGFAADKPDKFKIKSVKIAGNHAYTDKRLHRVIVSKPSVLFGKVYYYPDVLQDDIAGLELFYQRNGYLSVKVEDFEVQLDSAKHLANIRIRIDEGIITRVDGITIFGNEVFNDSELLRLIPLKPGDPLRHDDMGAGTLSLLTLYADHGYLDATVVPEIRLDSLAHLASIDFFIKENTLYSIDSVVFKGVGKTKLKVLLREMEFKSGDIVNYSHLLKSQRNLYLTGLFQSAYVRPVAPHSGKLDFRDILIEVKENKFREYDFSIGFGTVEGGRLGMGLYNTNWRGSAQKLGLTGKLSFIEAGTEASFSEPWTFGTRWKTDLAASINFLEDPAYNQKTTGGRISIGRIIYRKWSTSITYRHQNVELSKIRIVTLPEDIRVNIRSLKLTLSQDSRDNLFNPTKGAYIEQSVETAGLFRSASVSFTRVRFLGRYIRKVREGTVLATGLDLAWMGSPRGFNTIILNERLYAGGPTSIRGFKYKHAGPLDFNGYPTGGGFMVVCNVVEVRQLLYKMLGGAIFLDVGNVWRSVDDARVGDLRIAPGLGLRLNTPLGLFRIDYGFNIEPRGSEPSGVFHFSVGQAF